MNHQNSFESVTNKLTIYDLVHRKYLTPVRSISMAVSGSDLCWRCEHVEGVFYHTLWNCTRINLLLNCYIIFGRVY